MNPSTKRASVLFLCTGNSCRSQMAEGWARHLHGESLDVESAGSAPTGLDPRALAVMAELGVDISCQRSEKLTVYLHRRFDLVITVCDRARESCPSFPKATRLHHESFPDPPAQAAEAADEETALAIYRSVRDAIREFVATLPALLHAEEKP